MPTPPPDSFFDLSSALTGFTVQTLKFAQQNADFYGAFRSIYGAVEFDALMSAYADITAQGDTGADLAKSVLADGSTVAETARALMVFWYLGQIAPGGKGAMQIPTANHYAQGLAWRAVQAHPTGVSTLQFGYWASPPPPLEDFL
ncbi:MAG: hypothetical protein AAFN94_05980 [Pseudomonadota bacterium]